MSSNEGSNEGSSSTEGKHKRSVDDEREENALIEAMNSLSVDRHFVCPPWLEDYAQFAACTEHLQELMRQTLANYNLHNCLTALSDAFRASGLDKYFASDAHESPIERETFRRVFDDRILPHKSHGYDVYCPGDPALSVIVKKTLRYIERVCALLDANNLFLYLSVFARLRLQPFTNPLAVAIHERLDEMSFADRCALLGQPREAASQWTKEHYLSVRHEIYWVFGARAKQKSIWEAYRRDVDALFMVPAEQASNYTPIAATPVVHPTVFAAADTATQNDNDDDNNGAARIEEEKEEEEEEDNVIGLIKFTPTMWQRSADENRMARDDDGDSDTDLDDK